MRIYESVFMESFHKQLYSAMKEIHSFLKKADIEHAFIGGAAVNEYNYSRMTEDIDLLISQKDRPKIKTLPPGWVRVKSDKSMSLHEPKTRVDIIYSGEGAGDQRGISYKTPSEIINISSGLPFISLPDLVAYKLSSYLYGQLRDRDRADVIELIQRNRLNKGFLLKYRDDIRSEYQKVWTAIYETIQTT